MSVSPPAVSLYLHVPFCLRKCVYCDFYSGREADEPRIDSFVTAALGAVDDLAQRGLLGDVPSVYVGGGTPTVMGDALPRLVSGVLDAITLRPSAEVTVEANPESLSAPLLDACLAAGVNRVSLGVQSLNDVVLRLLGRCHTAEQAQSAIALLSRSGVAFSVDLMCGIPGLSDASWLDTVERAISARPSHVSVYPLSIEEGTALFRMVTEGAFPAPDQDSAAAQMQAAAQWLREAGYRRYEVASYALEGGEARHNVGYWTGVPYLGVGPSAASMLPAGLAATAGLEMGDSLEGVERARFISTGTLDEFLVLPWSPEPREIELMTAEETAREDAMLGMRLADGITGAVAASAGAEAILAELAKRGLVVEEAGRWRTTERGWLLGNEVFSAIWLGEDPVHENG